MQNIGNNTPQNVQKENIFSLIGYTNQTIQKWDVQSFPYSMCLLVNFQFFTNRFFDTL